MGGWWPLFGLGDLVGVVGGSSALAMFGSGDWVGLVGGSSALAMFGSGDWVGLVGGSAAVSSSVLIQMEAVSQATRFAIVQERAEPCLTPQ